jgi:hypothetical protein
MDLLLYLLMLGVPITDEDTTPDDAENDDVPREQPDEAVPSPPGRGKG